MEFPVKKKSIKITKIRRFIKDISIADPCTLVTPWGASPLHLPMQRPWLLPYHHVTGVPSD
jgi:hypothetical protein